MFRKPRQKKRAAKQYHGHHSIQPNQDLSHLDLSKENHANENLEGCIFNNTNLNYANFSEANLRKAQLSSASCQRTNFTGAHLEGAHLPKNVYPMDNAIFENSYVDHHTIIPLYLFLLLPNKDQRNIDKQICVSEFRELEKKLRDNATLFICCMNKSDLSIKDVTYLIASTLIQQRDIKNHSNLYNLYLLNNIFNFGVVSSNLSCLMKEIKKQIMKAFHSDGTLVNEAWKNIKAIAAMRVRTSLTLFEKGDPNFITQKIITQSILNDDLDHCLSYFNKLNQDTFKYEKNNSLCARSLGNGGV